MEQVFFMASKDALDNITSTFNFLHPLNASLQFTRKAINDLIAKQPQISDFEIKRTIDPDDLVHGVAYRNSFVDTIWNAQEDKLAWLLLNNLFAIHEGWAQRLYEDSFSDYYTPELIKTLEFPGLSNQLSDCFINVILHPKLTSQKIPGTLKSSIIMALKSSALESAFFQEYKNACTYDFAKLENYLLCYRCFKEVRNCFMHHNCVASQQLKKAFDSYIQIATINDLGVKEVPIISTPVVGNSIQLKLRTVIGFSQIVRRIIIISDINLLCTKAAENEFLKRTPPKWTCHTLNGDLSRAKGQIIRYSTKMGFLKPRWTQEYQDFLIANNIFSR